MVDAIVAARGATRRRVWSLWFCAAAGLAMTAGCIYILCYSGGPWTWPASRHGDAAAARAALGMFGRIAAIFLILCIVAGLLRALIGRFLDLSGRSTGLFHAVWLLAPILYATQHDAGFRDAYDLHRFRSEIAGLEGAALVRRIETSDTAMGRLYAISLRQAPRIDLMVRTSLDDDLGDMLHAATLDPARLAQDRDAWQLQLAAFDPGHGDAFNLQMMRASGQQLQTDVDFQNARFFDDPDPELVFVGRLVQVHSEFFKAVDDDFNGDLPTEARDLYGWGVSMSSALLDNQGGYTVRPDGSVAFANPAMTVLYARWDRQFKETYPKLLARRRQVEGFEAALLASLR